MVKLFLMKKKLYFLATLALAAPLLAGCSLFGSNSDNGNNNNNSSSKVPNNSTKITSVSDLEQLNNAKGNFSLENDLDLGSVSNWTPIKGFAGALYGNSHKISNLKISTSSDENMGFFASLNGQVSDLSISGSITVSGETKNIGILAGTNAGTLNNITASGTIEAEYASNVGGVAGLSNTGKINNVSSSVNIKGDTSVGGIAGYLNSESNSSMKANQNTGKIQGKEDVGGIFGRIQTLAPSGTSNTNVEYDSFSNSGEITASGDKVGGLIGYQAANTSYGYYSAINIVNSSNSGVVKGKDQTGGFIGRGRTIASIKTSSNTAAITGENYVGGYVGNSEGTAIENVINEQNITGNGYVGGIAGYAGNITSCSNKGKITSNSFMLDEEKELACVGGIAGYCTLINDCTNSADITVSHGGRRVGGIVGAMYAKEKTTCKNNTNSGKIVTESSNCVGGIVGRLLYKAPSGTSDSVAYFDSCTNSGNISSKGLYTGGIIGYDESNTSYSYATNVSVTNCSNTGTITSTNNYVGGLVGYATHASLISTSQNSGKITGATYTGGFVGSAPGATFKNLTNTVEVTGKSYLGGIAGYGGAFENCKNKGNITFISSSVLEGSTAIGCVGGIAGYATGLVGCSNEVSFEVASACTRVGGLVGEMLIKPNSTVENNTNSGNVTSKGNSVGGIVGRVVTSAPSGTSNETANFSNNVNSGNISSTGSYVGGIVGIQSANSDWLGNYYTLLTFTNNQCSGDINGDSDVAGIIGQGKKVSTSNTIWQTNSVTGNITGNSNTGEYYGRINL